MTDDSNKPYDSLSKEEKREGYERVFGVKFECMGCIGSSCTGEVKVYAYSKELGYPHPGGYKSGVMVYCDEAKRECERRGFTVEELPDSEIAKVGW